MQSTKNRLACDLAISLGGAVNRRVLVKWHVCPAVIVIFTDVFMQSIIQVFFIENDHMVQTLTAQRTHDPFSDWILPWASGGSRRVFESKAFYRFFELFAEDSIVIPNDILGSFIKGKGFTKLLNGPLRVRIWRNTIVYYFESIMRYSDKYVYWSKEECSGYTPITQTVIVLHGETCTWTLPLEILVRPFFSQV